MRARGGKGREGENWGQLPENQWFYAPGAHIGGRGGRIVKANRNQPEEYGKKEIVGRRAAGLFVEKIIRGAYVRGAE